MVSLCVLLLAESLMDTELGLVGGWGGMLRRRWEVLAG